MTGPMTGATTDAHDDIEAIRQNAVARVRRCVRAMLVALGRDYEHCGKAACARSRRCRGFACEPDIDGDEP